ncbi:MAG: metallophosphoesterase [Clostridia bacterium]|nr:metallophosphoesterase [Clostridia bacterium]
MSAKFFIQKYIAQLKALNPKYDTIFELHSEENPVIYQDRENLRLSFAMIADTHLPNRESASANLNNFFLDAEKSGAEYDAMLMAGDIADWGFNSEYDRVFDVMDKQTAVPKIFLTMGNHDVRVFFKNSRNRVMERVDRYLGIETKGKTYYSYDIKGYTFIVICTERRLLEKASLTKEQIDFLDKELARATKDGKPVFVMCHQAFKNTHGLPEVWKTGDMGEESDEVRAVMEKYKNVFFINGHLHGGIFEKTLEVLKEENNVYSLSVPGYRKENNFGIKDCGTGYYAEVYDDRVVFTARKFISGEYLEGDYTKFEIKLI